MKKLLTLLTSITLLLTSCSSVKEPVIKQFDTAHFDDASYIFDGHPHILNEVKDVPEGTTVTYEGRESYTNVGTYPATALLEKDGYESLTLSATLSITPANFSGIVFASQEVEYDGQEHTLTCTGVPSFATVTYTNNVGTEIGVYNATAVISAENYNDLTLNATLTITTPLLDFDDAKMEDAIIDYDGQKHTIEPTGIPEGTKVIYKGTYEYTNVGTYIISCTLSKDGYHDKDLSATLTINSATLSGVIFDDLVVMYDGKGHEITVKNAPSGSKVTYSCKSGSGANKFKNVGVYEVEATVTLTNYYPLVLTATLSIVDETLLVTTDANKDAYTFEEPLMWDPVFSEMMKGNYTLRLTSGYWDDDNPDVKNDYSDGTYIASDGVDAIEYNSRDDSELKHYEIYTNCGKDAVYTELNYSEDGDFYQNKLPSAAMDETEIKYYIGKAFVGLQKYSDGRIINGIDLDDYYASEGRAEVFNNHLVITLENGSKLDSGVYRYFYEVYDFYNVGNTKLNIPTEYYLEEEQIQELGVYRDYMMGGVRYGKHLVSTWNSPNVLMAHLYLNHYQKLILEPGVHYVSPDVYGNPVVRVVYYYYTERSHPTNFMSGYTLNVYFDEDGYYQGEFESYGQTTYKASEFVSKGGVINFYDQWANS